MPTEKYTLRVSANSISNFYVSKSNFGAGVMKNSLPITPPSSFSLPHILQRKELSRRNNAKKGGRAETKTHRLAALIRRKCQSESQ
jgi:hypothetical protein